MEIGVRLTQDLHSTQEQYHPRLYRSSTVVVLYQLSYQVLAVSTTAKPYTPLTIQDNQCPLNGLCQQAHFTHV